MTELLRRDRLLAKLAEWDHRREKLLRREFGPASADLELEIERPALEREPLLQLKACGEVLDAGDDSDESIARSARLVELLRWISNHRYQMERSDPRESIASNDATKPVRRRAIEHLTKARQEYLEPRDAARLDAFIDELRRRPTIDMWARGHDSRLIGTRGTAKKLINRWRALLIREISALVPVSMMRRDAAIAELLTAAGIETIPKHVQETLKYRKP